MIYFDVTKAGKWGHKSGVGRVSEKLLQNLPEAVPVVWDDGKEAFLVAKTKKTVQWSPADAWVGVEIFSPAERKGFEAFLAAKPCRLAMVFHDAIPLKFPEITWPHSVARHAAYMKMLSRMDRVFAVSAASARDLKSFLNWQDSENSLEILPLANGADLCATRDWAGRKDSRTVVCVGILEPRKNQKFLLEVARQLWAEGVALDLHLVGRVNPFFGRQLAQEVKKLHQKGVSVTHHEKLSDEGLSKLMKNARAAVFPTRAEGSGLPLVEALWAGLPCVASDLPVLHEHASAGVVWARVGDTHAWKTALKKLLTDDAHWETLRSAANASTLPTWAGAAQTLRAGLGSSQEL